MIYSALDLPEGATLAVDLCVIGSGAGGAAAAMAAAEAGLDVVVLEAGRFLPPAAMTQREEEMLPQLYWDSGGRTTADRGVHVHQGRGVGGSTLHNLNLCKRIPSELRAAWARDRGLDTIPWDALYDEVEALLEVSDVAPAQVNVHNQLLRGAAEALGWAHGPLRHNRTGCVGSGFCELGCAYDAKNNAAKVLIPRAIEARAQVLTSCHAVRVLHADGRVVGVAAVARDPLRRASGPPPGITIRAPRVCLAASATGTAALLLRSEVPDPGGETGRRLRIHPAVVVAGDFEHRVNAWRGVPQTWECTEHLDVTGGGHRSWIVPGFAHPVGTAVMLGGIGRPHADLMARYAHLGVFTAMLHDRTAGVVSPDGDLGLTIDYWPDAEDRRELTFGLEACARLMVAAGARRVILGTDPPTIVAPGDAVDAARSIAIERGRVELTAVHPMGSVPMGADPRVAAVGPDGAHHHVQGLWVADGSLFPSSIGVPPQLSIYALGLHVGRAVSSAG